MHVMCERSVSCVGVVCRNLKHFAQFQLIVDLTLVLRSSSPAYDIIEISNLSIDAFAHVSFFHIISQQCYVHGTWRRSTADGTYVN